MLLTGRWVKTALSPQAEVELLPERLEVEALFGAQRRLLLDQPVAPELDLARV